MKRPETGPMQFPDDWPGIFLRGDDAIPLALDLEMAAALGLGRSLGNKLIKWAKVLRSCDVQLDPQCQLAERRQP